MRKIRKLSFEYFGERVNLEYNIVKAGKSFNRNRKDLESDDANEQKEAMIQSLTGAIINGHSQSHHQKDQYRTS